MRHISAYILATLGGNANPSADDVTKILKSAGIASDAEAVKKLIAELNGKNVESVVAAGLKKFASVLSGVAVAAAPAASSAAAPAAAAAKEAPKKKEESEEEMGLGLFD